MVATPQPSAARCWCGTLLASDPEGKRVVVLGLAPATIQNLLREACEQGVLMWGICFPRWRCTASQIDATLRQEGMRPSGTHSRPTHRQAVMSSDVAAFHVEDLLFHSHPLLTPHPTRLCLKIYGHETPQPADPY